MDPVGYNLQGQHFVYIHKHAVAFGKRYKIGHESVTSSGCKPIAKNFHCV